MFFAAAQTRSHAIEPVEGSFGSPPPPSLFKSILACIRISDRCAQSRFAAVTIGGSPSLPKVVRFRMMNFAAGAQNIAKLAFAAQGNKACGSLRSDNRAQKTIRSRGNDLAPAFDLAPAGAVVLWPWRSNKSAADELGCWSPANRQQLPSE